MTPLNLLDYCLQFNGTVYFDKTIYHVHKEEKPEARAVLILILF